MNFDVGPVVGRNAGEMADRKPDLDGPIPSIPRNKTFPTPGCFLSVLGERRKVVVTYLRTEQRVGADVEKTCGRKGRVPDKRGRVPPYDDDRKIGRGRDGNHLDGKRFDAMAKGPDETTLIKLCRGRKRVKTRNEGWHIHCSPRTNI